MLFIFNDRETYYIGKITKIMDEEYFPGSVFFTGQNEI